MDPILYSLASIGPFGCRGNECTDGSLYRGGRDVTRPIPKGEGANAPTAHLSSRQIPILILVHSWTTSLLHLDRTLLWNLFLSPSWKESPERSSQPKERWWGGAAVLVLTKKAKQGRSSWRLWWCGLSQFSLKLCLTSALSCFSSLPGSASINFPTGSSGITFLVILSLWTLLFLSSTPPSPLQQVPSEFAAFCFLCCYSIVGFV